MKMKKKAALSLGLLLIASIFGARVWADVEGTEETSRGWTNKSYHESGTHYYKHPHHGSFTSPFDYGSHPTAEAPAPRVEAGKCNQFTFDATKSYDIDKQKLSVTWDFGDGTTSDQPTVTHVYEKAGDYNVSLTVKDSSGMVCDTGVATTKVSANYPPTCVAGDDKSACVGENIAFDATGSTASGPAKYTWDFGDGQTAEGARVNHAYEKAGNYRVVLTVDDQKGTQCSVSVCSLTVSVSERASVSLNGVDSVCTGRAASFVAEGTSGKYTWDFGDGSTQEGGSRATHVYQKGGNYNVTVTVDNGKGLPCSVAVGTTKVKVNGTPIADAGDNLACCVGKSVSFDGTKSSDPDGDSLSYRWDFGDGATSEDAKTTHTYEKNGNYRVVLTVKDSSGSDCGMSSSSFVATVNAQPEAVIEVR